MNFGTLNDLDATQSLVIGNSSTSTAYTLTLNGGGNTVSTSGSYGGAAADLIFVPTGGNLTITNTVSGGNKTLGLVLPGSGSGNFDVGGNLTVGSIISGGAGFDLTKTGTGVLTLSGTNTFGGAGTTFTLSAGTLNINTATA